MAYNILMLFFIMLSFFDVFIIKQKKNKFLILILVFLGYLFFFGLRGFTAWDWVHYYPNYQSSINFFEAIKNNFIFSSNIYNHYEIGFQIWTSIFKIFTNNYHMYLFFTTLIDISCLLIIFHKYSPYPVFSIFLFLGFSGFQFQFDLMRNFKAILLFLFSIEYLINNKKIKYLFLNIVGSTLHRSLLIFLLVGYFFKIEFYKYKKLLLLIFGFGIIFFIFSDDILYEVLKFIEKILKFLNLKIFTKIIAQLNFYLGNDFARSRGLGLGFIERIISFGLLYVYKEKINKDKYGKIFFNIFLLYIISYLYGSGVRIIFERLGLLFICSYWIVYPILLKNISKLKKILIFIFLISFSIMKINSYYVFDDKGKELNKYQNIIWSKETYKEKYKIFKKVFERYDRNKKKEQN